MEDILNLAKPVLDAVMSGNSWLAAALALVAVVAAARRYLGPKVPFLTTDAGGALLALVASFGGAAATALTAGQAPSLALAWMSVKVAVLAAGTWSMLRKLLLPVLEKVKTKLPAWAHPVVDLVLWFLNRPDPVAKAEKAGADAVAAKPSTGVAGVVGKSDEIE